MEVNRLDSPGRSSGYCSGTEDEVSFPSTTAAAILDANLPEYDFGLGSVTSLESSWSDDVTGLGGDGEGTPMDVLYPDHEVDLLQDGATEFTNCGNLWESRFQMQDSTSVAMIPEPADFRLADPVQDSRNFKESRDAWIYEMLCGNFEFIDDDDFRYEDLENIDLPIMHSAGNSHNAPPFLSEVPATTTTMTTTTKDPRGLLHSLLVNNDKPFNVRQDLGSDSARSRTNVNMTDVKLSADVNETETWENLLFDDVWRSFERNSTSQTSDSIGVDLVSPPRMSEEGERIVGDVIRSAAEEESEGIMSRSISLNDDGDGELRSATGIDSNGGTFRGNSSKSAKNSRLARMSSLDSFAYSRLPLRSCRLAALAASSSAATLPSCSVPAKPTSRNISSVPSASNTGMPSMTKAKHFIRTNSSPQIIQRTTVAAAGRLDGAVTAAPAESKAAFLGLEDHRYFSRRSDSADAASAVNGRLSKSDGTAGLVMPSQQRRNQDGSRYSHSVLETLLRTTNSFNPNKGSNAILSRESKKRTSDPGVAAAPHASPAKQTRTTRRPPPAVAAAAAVAAAQPRHHHASGLLHSLLTCEMDQLGRGGKSETETRQIGIDEKEVEVEGDGEEAVDEGLIPSDNLVVDCSFLFDDDRLIARQPETADDPFDVTMTWMDDGSFEEKNFQTNTEEEETDVWFMNYLNQNDLLNEGS